MRYIVILWEVIDEIPPNPFTPCCFYYSFYVYLDYLLVEETEPYVT